MREFQTIEELVGKEAKLVEVELMLTPKELQIFAAYCIKNDVKFNDWVRELAYEGLARFNSKNFSVQYS